MLSFEKKHLERSQKDIFRGAFLPKSGDQLIFFFHNYFISALENQTTGESSELSVIEQALRSLNKATANDFSPSKEQTKRSVILGKYQ